MIIEAKGKYYRTLNQEIRDAIESGETEITLNNVNGQRYIADAINKKVNITINGVPGNNLGSFMDGPSIIINNSAQEQVGNTMNDGKIVIHGNASDVVGYGMRGGKVFVKGDVGFRVGIHMKEYKTKIPIIVVGGGAGDFFGEYMAGGTLILLGLNKEKKEDIVGDYMATGMHGGKIFVRGYQVPTNKIGKEPAAVDLTDDDTKFLNTILKEYADDMGFDLNTIMSEPFYKYIPYTHRPYGKLYAPNV